MGFLLRPGGGINVDDNPTVASAAAGTIDNHNIWMTRIQLSSRSQLALLSLLVLLLLLFLCCQKTSVMSMKMMSQKTLRLFLLLLL